MLIGLNVDRYDQMEDGEVVLSDVHLNVPHEELINKKLHITRFHFTLNERSLEEHLLSNTSPGDHQDEIQKSNLPGASNSPHLKSDKKEDKSNNDGLPPTLDEDGDPVLTRKKQQADVDEDDSENDLSLPKKMKRSRVHYEYAINIVHSLATELKDIGEQVWNGALLMGDYIIHNRSSFTDKSVLDLGAGTGLTSVVAAFFAGQVTCTDTGVNILKLAQHNMELNHDVLEPNKPDNFCVGELDWFCEELLGQETSTLPEPASYKKENVDIIIAADVIYDDDITDAFFRTIYKIMSKRPSKVLYITIEKRYIFTISDKEIVCPAYDHFCTCLDDLHLCNEEDGVHFEHEEIPVCFPQYFDYERTKEMVMWKISTVFPGG